MAGMIACGGILTFTILASLLGSSTVGKYICFLSSYIGVYGMSDLIVYMIRHYQYIVHLVVEL